MDSSLLGGIIKYSIHERNLTYPQLLNQWIGKIMVFNQMKLLVVRVGGFPVQQNVMKPSPFPQDGLQATSN